MSDNITVGIMPLDSDEARAVAFRVAMSMYLGEFCKYCDGEFKTLEDLKDAVYAGYHARGRVAHKACWDANNPPTATGGAVDGAAGATDDHR